MKLVAETLEQPGLPARPYKAPAFASGNLEGPRKKQLLRDP